MQEIQTMPKTKIEDLPKGTEELDAKEQKAAKGGATIVAKQTLAATQAATLLSGSASAVAKPVASTLTTVRSKLTP
jgi:hypothetical protein